jgi:hypothetical protein
MAATIGAPSTTGGPGHGGEWKGEHKGEVGKRESKHAPSSLVDDDEITSMMSDTSIHHYHYHCHCQIH